MQNQINSSNLIKKILIIDDHFLFSEGLVSIFRSAPDFKIVDIAGSVHEGVERSRHFQPDIILMDFSLPDGTGLDATEIILKELPDCKIVFLTVAENDEILFAAIRSGAKGYLPKSIVSYNLLTSLRALDRDEFAISRKLASRIAVEFANTRFEHRKIDETITKLSPREIEVLCELQAGLTNQEIAKRLSVSVNTIKHHMRNILSILEVENRREAISVARKAGMKSKFY